MKYMLLITNSQWLQSGAAEERERVHGQLMRC